MARSKAEGKTSRIDTRTRAADTPPTATETELQKLVDIFSPLPENERAFLQPLLENAAFMRATLDELQAEIRRGGAVEEYQNGANQHGVKISATIQAYNQMMKTYHALMDKLLAKLPTEDGEKDSLKQFRL